MLSGFFVLVTVATAVVLVNADAPPAAAAGGGDTRTRSIAQATRAQSAPTDAAIAEWRTQLLQLAVDAASKMPVAPHIKNRSQAQSHVVRACLELNQPERAVACIEKIVNWRRGEGYAALACWCAQHGHEEAAQSYLDLAEQVSENLAKWTSQLESEQSWRRDRIRAGIAKACLWLGAHDEAARFEAGLSASEAGPIAAARAARTGAGDLDELMKEIDAALSKDDLDQVRNALDACVKLFDRFYVAMDRRAEAKSRIEGSRSKLPAQMQIELSMALVEAALAHADQETALALVQDGQGLLDGLKWTPDHQIPLAARLAALRHRAGDEAGARVRVDAALALFENEGSRITDIHRADMLRNVAEAHASMGDEATAHILYARAVEEGVVNPNSRPRAEDLAATCISMALHDVEPDAKLLARCAEVLENLRAPW